MSQFGHETLNVYQESIRFITWINELLETIPKNLSVHNQLDRASTSIPLNIAEGNGKHTSADRFRYFDSARGSALECAACLDVLVAKKKVDGDKVKKGKISTVSNCFNVDRIDTSQLRAKCVKGKIKIMIKIEIKICLMQKYKHIGQRS